MAKSARKDSEASFTIMCSTRKSTIQIKRCSVSIAIEPFARPEKSLVKSALVTRHIRHNINEGVVRNQKVCIAEIREKLKECEKIFKTKSEINERIESADEMQKHLQMQVQTLHDKINQFGQRPLQKVDDLKLKAKAH